MGHREAMFPNDYDEDWPYPASGIQGFPQEVIKKKTAIKI